MSIYQLERLKRKTNKTHVRNDSQTQSQTKKHRHGHGHLTRHGYGHGDILNS